MATFRKVRAVLECATTSDAMAAVGAIMFVVLVAAGIWALSCPIQ